jgi:glutaredoxin
MQPLDINKVLIYGQGTCEPCNSAKALLKSKNIPFEYVELDSPEKIKEFQQKTNNARSVPQIFINDIHVGNYADLRKALGE